MSDLSHKMAGSPVANYRAIQRFIAECDLITALRRLFRVEAPFVLGDPTEIPRACNQAVWMGDQSAELDGSDDYCSSCPISRRSNLLAGRLSQGHFIIAHARDQVPDSKSPTSSVHEQLPVCLSSARRSRRVLATTVVSLTRSALISGLNPDWAPHAHGLIVLAGCPTTARMRLLNSNARALESTGDITCSWKLVVKLS